MYLMSREMVAVFMAFSTVFQSVNSPDNSPFSHSVLPVLSDLLVISSICLFVKVSSSPNISPSG